MFSDLCTLRQGLYRLVVQRQEDEDPEAWEDVWKVHWTVGADPSRPGPPHNDFTANLWICKNALLPNHTFPESTQAPARIHKKVRGGRYPRDRFLAPVPGIVVYVRWVLRPVHRLGGAPHRGRHRQHRCPLGAPGSTEPSNRAFFLKGLFFITLQFHQNLAHVCKNRHCVRIHATRLRWNGFPLPGHRRQANAARRVAHILHIAIERRFRCGQFPPPNVGAQHNALPLP